MMAIRARNPQDDFLDKQRFVEDAKNEGLQNQRLAQGSANVPSPLEELMTIRQTYRSMFDEALLRNRALVEAIELAAEQVQDRRLALGEAGPEITANSIIFSVLVTFLVDSNLAGRIATGVVGTILKPFIRLTAAIKMVRAKEAFIKDWVEAGIPHGPQGGVEGINNMVMIAESIVKEETKLTKDAVAKWTSSESTFRDTFTGGVKAYQAIHEGLTKAEKQNATNAVEVSLGLDSPGVAFRRLGYNYLGLLSAIHSESMALFNDSIAEVTVTPGNAYNVFKRLWDSRITNLLQECFKDFFFDLPDKPSLNPSPEEIRFILSLSFEKAIWCLLYGSELKFIEEPLVRDFAPEPLSEQHTIERIRGVDRRLVEYWLSRFPNPKTNEAFDEKSLYEHMRAITTSLLSDLKERIGKGQNTEEKIQVVFPNPPSPTP